MPNVQPGEGLPLVDYHILSLLHDRNANFLGLGLRHREITVLPKYFVVDNGVFSARSGFFCFCFLKWSIDGIVLYQQLALRSIHIPSNSDVSLAASVIVIRAQYFVMTNAFAKNRRE